MIVFVLVLVTGVIADDDRWCRETSEIAQIRVDEYRGHGETDEDIEGDESKVNSGDWQEGERRWGMRKGKKTETNVS